LKGSFFGYYGTMYFRTAKSVEVVEYLHEVAPWELERLKSIDRLVSSWSDWGAERPGSHPPTYSSWLRDAYRCFGTTLEPMGTPGAPSLSGHSWAVTIRREDPDAASIME
jgi:hypothetical protein